MNTSNQIVEVVPLVTLPPQGNQKFSYLVPENIFVFPGTLVKIPFANRIIEGVVWRQSKSSYSNLKTIIGVEKQQVVTLKDIEWLEKFSCASFESLSLVTKTLVLNRKFSTELCFPKQTSPKKRGSIKFKFKENELDKSIKEAPSGQVLVLIPEIIMGNKVLEVCKTNRRICLFYNTQLSQKEKTETISAITKNESCVIVATHSGIFLPFSNLVTIILLEPALSSHRQWNMHPHYDARIGAYLKSKLQKIPLIHISILPSFDLYSSRKMKVGSLGLKNIIVLNKNWDESSFISKETINLIRLNINQGKKILIYHNAIGYESLYVCRDCGNTLRCEQCGTILQRQTRDLFCKTCKSIKGSLRAFCNKCGSPKLNALKHGTHSVEQSLKREFPQLNILRIDRDTKQINTPTQSLVDANIVIATQKIFSTIDSKIFDYCIIPDFTSIVNSTSFSALEETLITLKRLYGLIKNSTEKLIYIEDSNGSSGIINYIKNNKIDELIKNDLRDRKELWFPPYALLMTCEKEFTSEILAQKEILKIKAKISLNCISTKINTLIYKRRTKFVGQIIFRGQHQIIRESIKYVPSSWSIDAPLSLNDIIKLN
ncbi:MAG: hypothetical protein Q7S57_00625 [bacterium]|nr:hypothetical protein [bacterium]